MKKLLLSAISAFALSHSPAQAAVGWFSDFVLASVDGGAEQFYWIGDDPSFGTPFNNANFGTLTSLTFGADMRYFASDGDVRAGGALNVSINGGAFQEFIWNQTGPDGNNYQGLLPVNTVDVTAGLLPGSHTVTVYAKSWGEPGGDSFLSNGGANYTASFQVVPEPSTYALLGLAALGTAAHVIRRRRSA
jgi:hypothetical protein